MRMPSATRHSDRSACLSRRCRCFARARRPVWMKASFSPHTPRYDPTCARKGFPAFNKSSIGWGATSMESSSSWNAMRWRGSPSGEQREGAGAMSSQATELAQRLARRTEAVCRYYLSNGHREGRYWVVGDVANTQGRSLYVRLYGPFYGKGAAGKWTDAATGQHGDLLDLIALSCDLDRLADVLVEARRFLGLALPVPIAPPRPEPPDELPNAARRLLVMSHPLVDTIAETYLRTRGVAVTPDLRAL